MRPPLYFALGFITVLVIVTIAYVYFDFGKEDDFEEILNEVPMEEVVEINLEATTTLNELPSAEEKDKGESTSTPIN